MEKLSDFFAEIKNRITNPLLASFAISWLIINWKIVVGLFSPISILNTDGYSSYINLIDKNNNVHNFLWLPLLYAVLYTFVFSWIRIIILALNTWIRTISTNWNLRISAEGKIPMERYIVLRKAYDERKEILENTLASETTFLEENERLKNENLALKNENNTLFKNISDDTKAINNMTIMRGEWRFHYINEGGKGMRISILDNQISIINDQNETVKFFITDFFHNKQDRTIIFCRVDMNNGAIWAYHSLTYTNDEMFELKGTENHTVAIKYVKVLKND